MYDKITCCMMVSVKSWQYIFMLLTTITLNFLHFLFCIFLLDLWVLCTGSLDVFRSIICQQWDLCYDSSKKNVFCFPWWARTISLRLGSSLEDKICFRQLTTRWKILWQIMMKISIIWVTDPIIKCNTMIL